jgi:TonB family protein
MKKVMVASLITLLVGSVSAQIIPRLYYNKQWLLTTRDSASYFRVCVFDTINRVFVGEVNDFTEDGKPVMKGSYKSGKKNGEFTFYFNNGKPKSKGLYQDNQRTGPWKYFYQNGVSRSEVVFEADYAKGISFFNDSTGARLFENGNGKWMEEYEEPAFAQLVINEGNIKKGLKDGEWTCHLQDGSLLYTEKYSKGNMLWGKASKVLKGEGERGYSSPVQNHFLPHYKFQRTEVFECVPGVMAEFYPFLLPKPVKSSFVPRDSVSINGELFTVVEESAYPEGGMANFYRAIGQVIRYPATARKMGIEGRVFVEFVINKDGSLSEGKIVKGIGAGCDEEALRVVMESQKICPWHPGRQRGKPVKQRYTLPIIFKLSQARH